MDMNNYEWLLSRLDAFIRKYYANQVIRGSLVFLSCVLFFVLTVSVGEYYLYMPTWLRIALDILFVGGGLSALIAWIVIPLMKMARLGKTLSHEQAAAIVGKHFSEISDKLLNILQLRKQTDNYSSRELVDASISQKIKSISVVPITAAVDFSKNRKYLPYLLPLLLIGVFILVAAPNVFHDAGKRMMQPTKTFERPAPFSFILTSNSLKAVRNTDFTLSMLTKGSALPAEVYIDINGEKTPMQALDNHSFNYVFKNVTEAVNFRFFAAGYYSQEYALKVIQKPILKTFRVEVNYPAYTGRKDELRTSLSDMTVPVGTKIAWAFVADHTDDASVSFGSGTPIDLVRNGAAYLYQYRFMNDTDYTFYLHNKEAGISDSFRYHVQVIPDQYPVVQLQQFKDTVTGKQVLLTGTAGDDYAITRITFNYEVTNDKNARLSAKAIPLKAATGALVPFEWSFDIESLNLQPGQKVNYYIEAWDNDGVHGPKASRSQVMTYQMYDSRQIDSAINENSKQINSGLSNSAEQTQQLQSEYKDMQSKMLESENIDWQQQQSLKEMMNKQSDLQSQVDNVKKRFEEQKKESEQQQHSDDLKEKQQEVEKQFDNLSDELKEQMKKLQELMQQLNKDNAMDAMQQMQQENKLFKMDMQRIQEEIKKLEMQQRMESMANKMDDLAKKQSDLAQQTDEKKKDNQSLNSEQKDLKKQLDKAMNEDMKDLQKSAKETKQEKSLDQPQDQGKEAQQNMQKSENELDNSNNSNASQAQKKAAQNLANMAKSLRSSAGGMGMQQLELDIRATRQILSNLIRLSFDQEDLMNSVKVTSPSSQNYITNQEEQNRLHGNSLMIRDSLFALSKRNFKLSAVINKETSDLEYNMQKAVDFLENRAVPQAAAKEQYVMEHTNNLALMLNEVLSNLMEMESQAKKGNPGSGSCNNPGGMGKPKSSGPGDQMSDIITEQEKLGNAMQQAQKAAEQRQGNKPGQKPGGNQGNGAGNQGNGQGKAGNDYGDAEQLARLAEQQSAIRRKLQQLADELNSNGMNGAAHEIRDAQDKMDKIETDLVNRRVNNDLQARQKDIQTRLLQAEKSIREQEQDNKRMSNTGKEVSRPVPPELQKYITARQQMLELYKTVPPQLKPYYRSMVEHYFQMVRQ
jgi:hypothetical protein